MWMYRAKEGREGPGQPDAFPHERTARTPPTCEQKDIGVPFANELFGLEEAVLLGRGKRDAEQKKELALQK